METKVLKTKPYLKTRGLSTFHIELFIQILLGKTHRKIGMEYGYTAQSHSVVDHCRKVMYKLLVLEGFSKADYHLELKYPHKYLFWWKYLLDKHKKQLYGKAIEAKFYADNKTACL